MSNFNETRPIGPAARAAIIAALPTAVIAYLALYSAQPPTFNLNSQTYWVPLSWLFNDFVAVMEGTKCGAGLLASLDLGCRFDYAWEHVIVARRLSDPLAVRGVAILLSTAIAATVAAVIRFRSTELRDRLKHLDGPRLVRGWEAIRSLRKEMRKQIRQFGAGIWLSPGVQISRAREVENLLIVGMQGAGKTVILRACLEQVIARKDMVLLHDAKGDMVATLPTNRFILLAAHDARGAAYDVAADVTNWQAASELAARTIKDARDPTWSNAARQVLAALIGELIRTKPLKWTWNDLYGQLLLPATELRELLDQAGSPAARYINLEESGDPTKTAFGVLVTLWSAAVTIVRPLAEAWLDPATPKFSVKSWLHSGGKPARVVVLQRSSVYPELSEMLSGTIIETLAGFIADPALSIDSSRRLTLCLDELAQLARIRRFEEALAVGREKGLMTIAAIQDPAQLVEHYGQNVADQLLTLLGLKIISRLPRGPSANKLSRDLLGERRVGWAETTHSKSSKGLFDENATSNTSTGNRDAVVPVFGSDRLERDLGVREVGHKLVVRAILLGLGDCYLLDWPMTIWAKRRPAHQPAKWLGE